MTVSAKAQEAPPEPQQMPVLARERLVIQLTAAGMNTLEVADDAMRQAKLAGFTTRGLSHTSVKNILTKYRARILLENESELRDSYDQQRDRHYLYLKEYLRRWTEAALLNDEPRMHQLHTKVMAVEDRIAKLEGNYQDSAVDLDEMKLSAYMREAGLDDAEIVDLREQAKLMAANVQRKGFTVIQGGQS